MKMETKKIISVKSVLENTDVLKVMRCYDFKKYEKEEIASMKFRGSKVDCNTGKWKYVRDTLMITSNNVEDIGNMVRDLIDDIKMGYHRISDEDIEMDIMGEVADRNIYENTNEMHFDYDVLRDEGNGCITHILLSYKDGFDKKTEERELEEVIEYLAT